MDELRQAESAAAASNPSDPGRPALQALAFKQSFVGDTEAAERTNAAVFSAPDLSPEAIATATREVDEMLTNFEAREAVRSVVEAAKDRQIVILNEAHSAPRHRAFALLLARELRRIGFEYLAAETLAPAVAELAARGYPVVHDGYYSNEPVFGDFLRQALNAGFKPVAYEHQFDAEFEKLDMVARIEQREIGQARNLVERVLKHNPKARLFIYVGHSHVMKGHQDMGGGRRVAWMAEQLRVMTGIDPLCIDQTLATWREPAKDKTLTERVFANFDGDSFVLASKTAENRYWNYGKVDVQIWHRPVTLVHGRPHWLSMNGHRVPRDIPPELLPRAGRRLVQAFVANESADAVPMDQFLVSAGDTHLPKFMLPPGEYRFAWQD